MAVSFIYVIGPAVGPCKIGVAGSVARRCAALQTASPFRLQIHHSRAVPPELARRTEAAAHELLADRRLVGEWFDVPAGVAVAAVDRALLIAPTLAGPLGRGPTTSRRPMDPNMRAALRASLIRVATRPEDLQLPGGRALFADDDDACA